MKTVIEMAREAGIITNSPYLMPHDHVMQGIERFAELVRADERKACLEIADDCAESDMHASMVANFIRARSNK